MHALAIDAAGSSMNPVVLSGWGKQAGYHCQHCQDLNSCAGQCRAMLVGTVTVLMDCRLQWL